MSNPPAAERVLNHLVGLRARFADRRRVVATVIALCAVLIVLIGVADWTTGRDLSLAVLYLAPVMLSTLLVGRRAGLALSTLSLAAWLAADVLPSGSDNVRLVAAANALLRFVVVVVVVLLLSALYDSVQSTRAANAHADEFLAYAAHQLRTPLSGMSTAGQALLLDPPEGEREKLLAVINRESSRAGRLVTALLRVARLDQGERVEMEEAPIDDVVHAEVERWQARWPQVVISVEGLAETRRPVLFAADAARDIIGNLLDNACRHAQHQIVVTLAVGQTQLRVRVRDDGPGVPVGAEERVFERFVSLDGRGGSGLGLAIARQLARVNGGDLTCLAGAFVLTLPHRAQPPG